MCVMDDDFPVLASVVPVVRTAQWVRFHPEAVERTVTEAWDEDPPAPSWNEPFHFGGGTEETARWIFVLDVLNHCFWPDPGEPLWEVTFQGRRYSGYAGLAAALKKAVLDGYPLTDASFLAQMPSRDLEAIFSGTGRIPLFRERLENLREAGRILLEKWDGDVVRLIEWAAGSACRLVKRLVQDFPSFRDQFVLDGRPVYFWKRAQLFASDLSLAFEGKGLGAFRDRHRLTAFADYKLPQVLRAMGVLSYHPRLADRIDRLEPLASGSREEVEIRAMTLWAVEEIKRTLHRYGRREVTSAQVDCWLWSLGQKDRFRKRPYHRCRTIYY